MNNIELIPFSMRLAFEQLEQLTKGLMEEPVNWLLPGKVNPFSTLCCHIMACVDQVVLQ